MNDGSDEDLRAQFPPVEKTGEIGGESLEKPDSVEKTPLTPAAPVDGSQSAAVDGAKPAGKSREFYVLCRFVFVRGMALIYLIAFFSIFFQIDGLFGTKGILPIAEQMKAASENFAGSGPLKFLSFPAVFWFSSSDAFLKGSCVAGMIFAGLAGFGICCGPALLMCWALYLSFLTTGGEFMSYQWDILLLESGMLAALWAPWTVASFPLRSVSGSDGPPSKIVLWLIRWLLFRLMFMSGMCKLLSGDEAWWSLTALSFHYETQPLPTPQALFFSNLPMWCHKLSCVTMFGIEIISPFLIFGTSLTRRIACGALVSLQLLILFTGNYTFFNLLTILLCFTLIDDSLWSRILPKHWQEKLSIAAQKSQQKWTGSALMHRVVVVPMVLLMCIVNLSMLSLRTAGSSYTPTPVLEFLSALQQFHLVNGYGLFAVMTQKRIEIVLEGSEDGISWKSYEFACKPGDLKRPPPIVAPLQPRLDWQMWFAALGRFQDNPWFSAFVQRILEGDKEVTDLLAKNPFPQKPPLFLRAKSYQYHFTGPKELFATGEWWRREYAGEYMPLATLK
jgi:hypothetical protein